MSATCKAVNATFEVYIDNLVLHLETVGYVPPDKVSHACHLYGTNGAVKFITGLS